MTFDNNYLFSLLSRFKGDIHAKENRALGKQLRFTCIQIFRFTFANHSASKTNHSTSGIFDRYHYALTETVINTSIITLYG
ncbi:hypothetical protein SDC9_178096 [bioreactor metagenome]|uniref:Uncharacterized protein n=1 Tax=bioreactor metagenome TaxID=1076179 RepID=A0A645GV13_9ZZZZ